MITRRLQIGMALAVALVCVVGVVCFNKLQSASQPPSDERGLVPQSVASARHPDGARKSADIPILRPVSIPAPPPPTANLSLPTGPGETQSRESSPLPPLRVAMAEPPTPPTEEPKPEAKKKDAEKSDKLAPKDLAPPPSDPNFSLPEPPKVPGPPAPKVSEPAKGSALPGPSALPPAPGDTHLPPPLKPEPPKGEFPTPPPAAPPGLPPAPPVAKVDPLPPAPPVGPPGLPPPPLPTDTGVPPIPPAGPPVPTPTVPPPMPPVAATPLPPPVAPVPGTPLAPEPPRPMTLAERMADPPPSPVQPVAAPTPARQATIRTTPTKGRFLPLTGQYPARIEDRGVLALPPKVRELLGDTNTLYLTPGAEPCLWLTCAAGVERRSDKLERDASEDGDATAQRRLHLAQTERVALDRTGKVSLPDRLLQAGGLKQDVVIVGANDHFEIWDALRWQEFVKQATAEPAR